MTEIKGIKVPDNDEIAEILANYRWIKVPKGKMSSKASMEQQLADLEQHHIEETTFLINKVREFAGIIGKLTEVIEYN